MPIPILLGLGAMAAGAMGIKKGVDAKNDNDSAQLKYAKAERIYEEAKDEMEYERERTSQKLSDLGLLKLNVWDKKLGRFVSLVEKVKKVRLEGQATIDGSRTSYIPQSELAEMKQISLKAGEVVSGGVQALGAGALAGVASYGGATFLASASTGTALMSLSGAAATNATLSWFGGGSLAAGGLGIAGGTAVLGGIVAGPILAVGGFLMASKARENLAEARKALAEAEHAVEQMNNAISMMKAIHKVAQQFEEVIIKMENRLGYSLDSLERSLYQAEEEFNRRLGVQIKNFFLKLIGKRCNLSYDDLNDSQKKELHIAYQFAQATKILLETPILTKSGSLNEEAPIALESMHKMLKTG